MATGEAAVCLKKGCIQRGVVRVVWQWPGSMHCILHPQLISLLARCRMIHCVRIKDGKATYCNRFVEVCVGSACFLVVVAVGWGAGGGTLYGSVLTQAVSPGLGWQLGCCQYLASLLLQMPYMTVAAL